MTNKEQKKVTRELYLDLESSINDLSCNLQSIRSILRMLNSTAYIQMDKDSLNTLCGVMALLDKASETVSEIDSQAKNCFE